MAALLKTLTLNCWGLHHPISKNRPERIRAIGNEISKQDYDIVMLQEIWIQADYNILCSLILKKMPYTHYFHSGMFGSGLCIFSRHPIEETFQHNYTLCGYAHRVYHGDWFSGKAVGCARVLYNDFRINVYVTHTHADYHHNDEIYRVHRLVQAYELSQFIKHTGVGCDMVIAGGDFNFQPHDLGFRLVSANANLKDTWTTQRQKPEDEKLSNTADRPDNTFTWKGHRDSNYPGKRIDYILYRNNSGCLVTCNKSLVTMTAKIPFAECSFSDHMAVLAEFTVKKNVTGMAPEPDNEVIEAVLKETIPHLEQGIKDVQYDQIFYGICFVGLLLMLLLLPFIYLPWGLESLIGSLIKAPLTLGLAFCFYMSIIGTNREMNAVIAAKKDIEKLIHSKTH